MQIKKKQNQLLENKAQLVQDKIFQKMSADRKLEIGSQLWQMAKHLAGDKINYGSRRPRALKDLNKIVQK